MSGHGDLSPCYAMERFSGGMRMGIPHQTLINLYLRDCATSGKRLKLERSPCPQKVVAWHPLDSDSGIVRAGEPRTCLVRGWNVPAASLSDLRMRVMPAFSTRQPLQSSACGYRLTAFLYLAAGLPNSQGAVAGA